MNCENIFCIYWSEKGCILKNIELDMQGRCISCIYINISEDVLQKTRKEQLK